MKILITGLVALGLTACQGDSFESPLSKQDNSSDVVVQEQDASTTYITEDDIVEQFNIPAEEDRIVQSEEEAQDMSTQIANAFANTQNQNGESLSATQASEGQELTMNVIAAAESGNPFKMASAANALVNFSKDMQAESNGFALVDVSGIIDAAMDLVAAALDLDVAGILDAIEDLIDAVLS